jgi:acetoin utilization protein AcuB
MPINIKVEEFTTPYPKTISAMTTVAEAQALMETNSFRHLLIEDENQNLIGLVSDRDVYKLLSQNPGSSEVNVKDIMSENLLIVSPESPLYDVALEMSQNKYGSAIVCEEGSKNYGIFTSTDALNALVEVLRGDINS